MQSQKFFILLFATLLMCAAVVGLGQALPRPQKVLPVAQLENVRDYQSALTPGGADYAVANGQLFVGHPGYWVEIRLPEGVIASAVEVRLEPALAGGLMNETIFVGAANELTVYRTQDRGEKWLRGSLTHSVVHRGLVGGITDLALDPMQRLLYAGTDTAGVFRVRDGAETLKSTAQLLLDKPVRQVVTDRQGSGMTFVRTDEALYRASEFGLQWGKVNLDGGLPTAMAMAASQPPAIYLGTSNRGVLRSVDGERWVALNDGLDVGPEETLHVDALAIDPLQPTVAYVAASRQMGTQDVRYTPDRLAYTQDGGASWTLFEHRQLTGQVTDLMPISGYNAATYLLTTTNRTLQTLGNAPLSNMPAVVNRPPAQPASDGRMTLAWIFAAMAAGALAFALFTDLLKQPEVPLSQTTDWQPRPARRHYWE